MKDKLHIDRDVCAMTGEPQRLVAKITHEFLNSLMTRVARTGEVHLPGFGTFRLVVKKGQRNPVLMAGNSLVDRPHDTQLMVSFKKSTNFKKLVRAYEGVRMEKYDSAFSMLSSPDERFDKEKESTSVRKKNT